MGRPTALNRGKICGSAGKAFCVLKIQSGDIVIPLHISSVTISWISAGRQIFGLVVRQSTLNFRKWISKTGNYQRAADLAKLLGRLTDKILND
jgi:hypothetical protein